MNLLGYEAAVLGNHEFDKPVDVLRQQEQQAKFPFLAANVRQKNGEYLVKPYTMLNKGGLKIAVVGLTTEDTPKLSAHAAAMDFEKPAAAARRTLKELAQTHRPDVRIALTHMGYYHNGKHGDNAPGDVSLARSLKNQAGQQFDLIIGGHSHTTVCVHEDGSFNHDFKPGDDCRPDYQNGAWIVQAGEWGKYLGRADFEFRNGRTKLVGYRLIPINLKQKIQTADGQTEYRPYGETIAPDAEVAAALQPYQDEGSRLLDINIGTGTGAFEGGRDAVRHRQTNLGRLITEAYRKRLKADIALVNSGAIRDSLPEGDITYKQVLKVHPFGNTMGRVRLSGRELSDYLHTVALKQAGSGAYAQFSGNLSMDIDHDNQRVRNIRINGRPLQAEQYYTVALTAFCANGGDGYPNLRQHPSYVDSGFVDAQVLKEYIMEEQHLDAAKYAP